MNEDLTDDDMRHAAELCSECDVIEKSDLWLPMFANCTSCNGFVFRPTNDVQRQLGACGCVVAMEMELCDQLVRVKAEPASLALLSDLSHGIALPADAARDLALMLMDQAFCAREAAIGLHLEKSNYKRDLARAGKEKRAYLLQQPPRSGRPRPKRPPLSTIRSGRSRR